MKKRLLVLFLVLVFSTSALMVPALASEGVEGYWTYNDVEFPNIEDVWTDKETYKYACICFAADCYHLILFETVPYQKFASNFYYISNYQDYIFDSSTDSWCLHSTNVDEMTISSSFAEGSTAYLVWSSVDFVSFDGTLHFSASDPVFMKPPVVILPSTLEGVQMTGVLQQIVTILPIVLVCLVCWIGLRKGLAILVQLLRKA